MIKRISYLLALIFATILPAWPGEGMWIPLEIDSVKLKEMQQNGFMLGPGEIYSHCHPSLKDAVVIFGGGCTGEVISPEGLVLTNHHCSYSRIQSHSTVEHNYLSDGFWALTRGEELPNPGLTVTFLVRMEDVTRQVLAGVDDSLTEPERNRKILENVDMIERNAQGDSHYSIQVKPFYFGRSYYLFVYEVFKDIRLVGAPPESIGRFGGDTDNWIWPRHSGDFALFRIYAGKDNLPAEYSPDNVPYKPRKYLSISIEGVRDGDFTMVLGYPARTDKYLTSQGLSLIAEKSFPAKIEMRQIRLDAMRDEMKKSPESRLRYAAKYVSVSNSWKKWIGVRKGIVRSDAVNARKNKEEQFNRWTAGPPEKDSEYASLLDKFEQTYDHFEPVFLAYDLGNELMHSIESFSLTNTFLSKYYTSVDSSRAYLNQVIEKLRITGLNFFRTGALEIDKQILPDLLRIYAVNTAVPYHPPVYNTIRDQFQNDYQAYVDKVFRKSYFTDSVRFKKLMNKKPRVIHELFWTDPLPELYREFSHSLSLDLSYRADSLDKELNRLYRLYVGGLMAMDTGRTFYPDANFTMRVAFGRVEGYQAADAVNYTSTSTLQGIMEKEDPDIADYRVLPRLRELYVNQDFGPWSDNGKMSVCFIASNHTSGGNSGSPVLNAEGELIGINFDRNWEGTVSDYVYDPNICRNISLDIRYVLFVIDKVARASWLLDEMTILHRK